MKLEQANALQQQGKQIIGKLDTFIDDISDIIKGFNKIRSKRIKNIEAVDYALSQMVERGEIPDIDDNDLRITVTGYHATPYYRTFMSILNHDKRKPQQQRMNIKRFEDVLDTIVDMFFETTNEKSKEQYLEMFVYLLRYIDGFKREPSVFLEILLNYPNENIFNIFFIRRFVKKLTLKELELFIEELQSIEATEEDIYFHKITPKIFRKIMKNTIEEVVNEARTRLKKRSHSMSFGRSTIPSKRPRPQTEINTKKWFMAGNKQTQQLDSYWELYKSLPISSNDTIEDIIKYLSHQPNINVSKVDKMLEYILKNNLVNVNRIISLKDLTSLINGLNDHPLLKSIDFILKTKLTESYFFVNLFYNKRDMIYRYHSPLAMSAFMYIKTSSPVARRQYKDLIIKLSSPPYDEFFDWAPRRELMISWFLFRLAIWQYYDLMRELASSMSDELLDKTIKDTKYLIDNYHRQHTPNNKSYLQSKDIKLENAQTLFRRMLRIFTTEKSKRGFPQQNTQSQRSQQQSQSQRSQQQQSQSQSSQQQSR